ncbi:CHASE domain-containing protein [Dechloromonas denitrificans]|uniref:CHASE domain-containing protein n=1 Tax=Dechloromonas denitrificans TaxID=281362 RepID=UPI001CFA742F|nr:CHASE domain-containing protein [Dechloromonas denitrificans]UCV09944.1 diguanylate cyclase [Dechloromonas denitrificans]
MAVLRLFLPPWIILIAMLGVTWLVWDHERQSIHKELRGQFDFALRDTVSRIEQRITAYEQMLRGVQSLLATTDLKNRQAIHDYVETLQLDANFSGIQVVGVIERLPSDQKAAHIAAMHRIGLADYTIHPEGDRETYAPVIQREPEIRSRHAPLGLDPWADPVRRQAMEKACDSGMPAITGKVQLAVDNEGDPKPGFIMYLPVFAQGQPRDSVAQRRASLIGWVYASFLMQDFMASLYGNEVDGLAFAIYDDAIPNAATLMYANDIPPSAPPLLIRGGLSTKEYMVVAGHTWTLTLATQDEFEARFGRNISFVIAVTGIGLSLAMALLTWFMINGRARALRLAAGMTEELRHMAQHDPLTGLPNRTLFSDRVQHELAHAKRQAGHFALVFLDLDHFKPINDNYGHAIGDILLQQVAKRLQRALRASDTVGRIGGDEFVLLLAEVSGADAALALAEKIRHEIARPYSINGQDLTISCSLGVALYPNDGDDEISLTKSADEAMYQAKDSGRNSVCLALGGAAADVNEALEV